MEDPSIEGLSHIPSTPVLVIPNRITPGAVCALIQALGGKEKISWMLEQSHYPPPEILPHLSGKDSAGFLFSMAHAASLTLSDTLHTHLKTRHVVLVCAVPDDQATEIHGRLLSLLDETLDTLPVYVDDENRLHIMPVEKAGASLASRIQSAWLEAKAACMGQRLQLQKPSLAHALLHSLKAHPDALVHDGVDDSRLSYKRLLIHALIFSKRLQKQSNNRTIGIILPPGKYAAIANIACILAGMIPLNINYTASAASFRKQAKAAGITRYITETRFTQKQQLFAWPSPRDLIFIDREISTFSKAERRLYAFIVSCLGEEALARHIQLPYPAPEDTALLLFTTATGGQAKGVPYSHRMLLSGLRQMSHTLNLQPGRCSLSALPLYHPAGLLHGLLLPILSGMDIATYPSATSSRRLCHLARQYGAILTAFTPVQTSALLDAAKEQPDTFASMQHFLIVGEKAPASLVRRAAQEFNLTLQECYMLAEAASPVALRTPLPGKSPSALLPLPGMAIRITDLGKSEKALLPSSTGLIWIKGPSVLSAYLGNTPDADSCIHDGWFCTGDVGRLNEEGFLEIYGRQERFSKINDELVSHVQAEETLYTVLHLDPARHPRQLAVIGIPNPRNKCDMLVLLTTIHKSVSPHGLIDIRYKILNAHRPASHAPERMIPVSFIPTLPNGKLDYLSCRRGAIEYLNNARR